MAEKIDENKYSLFKSDYFIKSASRRYVFFSVISVVFLYASSLIDTVLVGLFIGEDGLTAMSLVSPIYLIYYTLGALIGIGASILASRELGKGNEANYNKIFSTALEIMVALTFTATAVGYIFINPITNALARGVTEVQKTMVKQYLLSYLPGGAFNLLGYIAMYFLKTDGRPKISAKLYLSSAVINIVLSTVFISPLCNMGIAGAGLATSLSLAVSTVIGMVYLLNGKAVTKFNITKIDFPRLKELLISGAPNGLSNFFESMRIIFVNTVIISIGCAKMLPCYTVIRNISDIILAVIIGISSAFTPMMGIFYGERDNKSERMLIKYAIKIGFIAVIPVVSAACIFSKYIFLLFGVTDTAIIKEGLIAIPLSVIGLIFGYINTLTIGYLTVIKREIFASVLVVLRLFAMLVLFALPLSALLGTYGIWASLSVCEIATFIIYKTVKYIIVARNKNLDKYLLDKSRENMSDLTFSVKNSIDEIVNTSSKITEYCDDQGISMKQTMKLSLAIEEILVFLINRCVGTETEKYIDLRVCKLGNEVMLRFRYTGNLFDPIKFYSDNSDNDELKDELLGIKMILKTASLTEFKQTLGANNLLLIF
ncbi:MAG: hypothetical protein MJ090_03275 [Clostridia bacterium]|nr:hypothetical protein [Clostridia bacterium]